MQAADVDIGIVGAGPAGASLAVALAASGLRLALIEAQRPAPAAPQWDVRVYAISPQSRSFLESLGAWRLLDAARHAPVRRMLVYGDAGPQLEFSAYDIGVSELASIVEAGALVRALWARLEGQPGLELVCPAVPRSLVMAPEAAQLGLDSDLRVNARLVVGADGANSFVRREAGIRSDSRPSEQMGVVANFQCRHGHRSTAFQWFRPDGVLAWLPLPGDRMSMVWSTSPEHARELLALSPTQLCQLVAEAGGNVLGELDVITPPAAFPISPLRVSSMTAARVALIGDAAHVVHPLAGQGVNLGFADAAQLAEVMCTPAAARDAGDALLLRRYGRARSEDVLAMRQTTDGLSRLFGASAPGVARLRNWGLNSVDRMPVLKTLLARHALG